MNPEYNQEDETRPIDDLDLSVEQAEETKAGTGTVLSSGISAGKVAVHD